MKLEQALEEFGLDSRESNVYLSLLQQERSTVIYIANKTGVKRTTVYDVLENLKDLGLVYISYEGKRKLWYAQPPKKLEEILKNRYEHIKMVIPELESYWSKPGVKPKIQYFEGVEGIKNAFGSLSREFKPNTNYYIISSGKDWFELDPKYFSDFVKERTRKSVQSWMITMGDPTTIRWAQDPKYKYKTKYFPPDVKFVANTVFYNNKIIFSLVEEKFAVVIESKFLYEQQKQLFNLLWKSLPDLTK